MDLLVFCPNLRTPLINLLCQSILSPQHQTTNTWVLQFGFQGMSAGHAYYFLEDVYPLMTGRRLLKTPAFVKVLFPEDMVVVSRPANGFPAAAGGQEVQRAF